MGVNLSFQDKKNLSVLIYKYHVQFNLHNKSLIITLIEGPEAEVTQETIFHFGQQGDLVWAEYSGGKVRVGRLVGVINGDRLNHSYVQINSENKINSGEGTSRLVLNEYSKIEIIEEWEWKSQEGKGKSVMTEI